MPLTTLKHSLRKQRACAQQVLALATDAWHNRSTQPDAFGAAGLRR